MWTRTSFFMNFFEKFWEKRSFEVKPLEFDKEGHCSTTFSFNYRIWIFLTRKAEIKKNSALGMCLLDGSFNQGRWGKRVFLSAVGDARMWPFIQSCVDLNPPFVLAVNDAARKQAKSGQGWWLLLLLSVLSMGGVVHGYMVEGLCWQNNCWWSYL